MEVGGDISLQHLFTFSCYFMATLIRYSTHVYITKLYPEAIVNVVFHLI